MKRATFQSPVNPVTTTHLSAFFCVASCKTTTPRWKAKTLLVRQQHPLKQPKETGELQSAPYVRSGWGAKVSVSMIHLALVGIHILCAFKIFSCQENNMCWTTTRQVAALDLKQRSSSGRNYFFNCVVVQSTFVSLTDSYNYLPQTLFTPTHKLS